MSEEINYTAALSPRDYGLTLRSLSPKILAEQAATNYWCWKNIQKSEIDYKARYLECLALQLQRGHLDNV